MPKKRTTAVAATTTSAFIKSLGYTLKVTNNSSNGTDFDINVNGEDGDEYNLQVTALNDRTALVQAMFQKIGSLWPANDFEFRADTANRILEVR